MKKLFTLLFVFFLHSAWATNYYFSAISGDDSRTPAEAQNPSTPWQTISKLNSYFTKMQPGDAVLLKRGETFYGSITISKSGTVSSPIVIGAYGTGNKPVITSLVTLNNWVFKGNGIWESYNLSLGKTVSIVLLNGVQQEMGRYPNSDAANKGYLTLESHTSNTITDNELTSSTKWTGAELVLRSRHWVTDRCLITNHSGPTITYAAVSRYRTVNGYGYFIQNDIKTLDKFGEWYYNPSAKKLSVYFGSNDPSSYTVQATTINDLICSKKYNNIVFDNLNIKGANASGIYVRFGSNIRVSNCDIMFSGVDGVAVRYHKNFKIENCSVSNSNANGINFGYSGDYATIRNNKITNTSVFSGMGGSGDGKGIGIQNYGNNTIIEYNEIINTGYCGITFNGNSTIVKNNFIDGYCMTKDDGGGIYTYTGPKNINKYGRKVIGNIVMNGIGVPEGTNDNNSAAEGIYLDENSSGIEISNNTIANIGDKGLFLNNARDLVVRNNTFYSNGMQFYAHQYRKIKGAAIRNLTVKQNIFFSKGNNQKAAYFTTEHNDNNLIGTLDSNYYARPLDDRLVILNSYVNSLGVRVSENLDLEGWKSKYNKDAASKKTAKSIAPYKLNSLTGSNKFANGTFSNSMRGVFPSSCKASLKNSAQLDGGYLEVVPSAKNSSVFVNIGELKAGAKYILRYSVKGSDSSTKYIGVSLRKASSPYTVFTPVQYRKFNFSQTDNEMVFSPSADEASAQIEFKSYNQNMYYLDNVQLYEADANITNIDDSIRFVYNAEKVSKTVNLNGSYVDVQNNKYSNSIVLEAFQSAVLIKDDVKKTEQSSVPTVVITSPEVNAEYKASATINISANATDIDGSIKKVEFYNDTTLLDVTMNAPYSYSWKNVEAGNYTITAKATDNSGNVTTSASVKVLVKAPSSSAANNISPKVNITNPKVSERYDASATIDISANASDADGKIKKVEFYNGATLLHTERYVPYTYSWQNVPAGNYTITAKATDNDGNVTTSQSVPVSVAASNAAPKVSITSPVINASYKASAKINISANASDADGKIRKVEYYNGSTLLHTETGRPYSWDWKNVRAGNYTITAVAIDDKGSATRSESVTVSVVPKHASHRNSGNNDTSVAVNNNTIIINNDTAKVVNNINAVALKNDFVSIAEPKTKTYAVKVFPNPAVNKIQISVDGLRMNNQKVNLSITSLSGIIVKSIPVVLLGKTIEADVTSLTSGIYIVSIVSDNLVISKKFIKN